MKLYFIEANQQKVMPLKQRLSKQSGDVIVVHQSKADQHIELKQKELGEGLSIEREELDHLIMLCGEKNIRSGKIRIYTPMLFMRERMEQEPSKCSLLKLDELCLLGKDGEVREISSLELTKNELAKYISFSQVFVQEEM